MEEDQWEQVLCLVSANQEEVWEDQVEEEQWEQVLCLEGLY